MNKSRQESICRMVFTASTILVVVCVGFLLFNYFEAVRLEPKDKALLKELEEGVKTDSAISVTLTAERDRVTAESLGRDTANKRVGMVLFVSTVLLLVSAGRSRSLRGEQVLPWEKLIGNTSAFRAGFKSGEPAQLLSLETEESDAIDLSFVDQVVEREGRATEAAIAILRKIQERYGYLPDEALRRVCELTEISPAQIAGTSTFYAQFRHSPMGKHLVKVCHGTACHVSGIGPITEELHRQLRIGPGEDTDPSRTYTVEKVACLGCCSLAPVMMVDDVTLGRLTPASACEALISGDSETRK